MSKALSKEIKNELQKYNGRIKTIYNRFGIDSATAQNLRGHISSINGVALNEKGLISLKSSDIDENIFNLTSLALQYAVPGLQELRRTMMSDLFGQSKKKSLQGFYVRKNRLYKESIPSTISLSQLDAEIEASARYDQISSKQFDKFYDAFKNRNIEISFDDTAERELVNDLKRDLTVGDKHIWSKSQYVDVFDKLQAFNEFYNKHLHDDPSEVF